MRYSLPKLQSARLAVAFGQKQAAADPVRLALTCLPAPGHPDVSSLAAPVAAALLTLHLGPPEGAQRNGRCHRDWPGILPRLQST